MATAPKEKKKRNSFPLREVPMIKKEIQSNLDRSNTDGSFTMANSNSFLSPPKQIFMEMF